MKLIIRIALSICIAALSAAPASAGWWYPFDGWWGAGYYGSPAYSAPMYSSYYAPSHTSYYGSASYTSSYGSFSAPSYGCCGNSAPAYAASYGSCGGGCCDNSCCQSSCGNSCNSCGNSCGSGCASNSCVGTTPAGSLKPAQDPISDKKAPDDSYDPPRNFQPRTRETDDLLDPPKERDREDRFSRPAAEDRERPIPGIDRDRDSGGMFDTPDPDLENRRKPPMEKPLDGEKLDSVEPDLDNPADGKTFYDENTKPDNTTLRVRDAVIARTSSLSEVIAPKRLASRSLPGSFRPISQSTLADKSNDPKSDTPRPLRWISAPLANGHVQL